MTMTTQAPADLFRFAGTFLPLSSHHQMPEPTEFPRAKTDAWVGLTASQATTLTRPGRGVKNASHTDRLQDYATTS